MEELTHAMCLASLALQRVFLADVVRVNTRLVSRVVAVALHMPVGLLI